MHTRTCGIVPQFAWRVSAPLTVNPALRA